MTPKIRRSLVTQCVCGCFGLVNSLLSFFPSCNGVYQHHQLYGHLSCTIGLVLDLILWALVLPWPWNLLNFVCCLLILCNTLVTINSFNCTKTFQMKRCSYSVQISICGYTPSLRHTCIWDTRQLMSACNHATGLIHITILLVPIIWSIWYLD